MTTLHYLFRHVIPAAYSLLPEVMRSPKASAMLLAIALQESGTTHRRQVNGPARGFWQFEKAGVIGVRTHQASFDHAAVAVNILRYPADIEAAVLQEAITDNDVLACVFARLLLWTLPDDLPERNDPLEGWRQYIDAWRPGKPHGERWARNYSDAWMIVNELPIA